MGLFGRRQQASGGDSREPLAVPKAKRFFEEKKERPISELMRGARKGSAVIPGTGGKRYSAQERVKLLEKHIPYNKFGSHLNEGEAKTILRELRKKEYSVSTDAEKLGLNRERRFLEKEWDLGGKY